ncbi:hypothetical protein CSPX01_08990 [Colletotrichum filicis]|nr:hypothetical protein CSPX01_08990 [Colletotrichum filicis]
MFRIQWLFGSGTLAPWWSRGLSQRRKYGEKLLLRVQSRCSSGPSRIAASGHGTVPSRYVFGTVGSCRLPARATYLRCPWRAKVKTVTSKVRQVLMHTSSLQFAT